MAKEQESIKCGTFFFLYIIITKHDSLFQQNDQTLCLSVLSFQAAMI